MSLTIIERLRGLLTYANETTGEDDGNITDAIIHLVEGYGSGTPKSRYKYVTVYPDWAKNSDDFVLTFVANDGYTLDDASVKVYMNGNDVTESAYRGNGAVVIDELNGGDVVVQATATKIDYVVPPVSDFTTEIGTKSVSLKSYNGTETAIEIPAEIMVDGAMMPTKLYNMTIPATVEHLKLTCGVPAFGALISHIPNTSNCKTVWNNTGTDLTFKSGANSERLITADQSNFNSLKTVMSNARIVTARQLIYPSSATGAASAFYMDSGLVDAGVVPAHITNMKAMFQGCTRLRRVAIDAVKNSTFGNMFDSVPSNCKVRVHFDSDHFEYFKSQAVRGTGSGWAKPIIHILPYDSSESLRTILCIGDSLTRGIGCDDATKEAYPVKLMDELSANTIVYNEGAGSTTVIGHKNKVEDICNKQYYNDPNTLVILWTGTNGNGNGDNTVDTLKNYVSSMVETIQPANYLLIPAVAAALGVTKSNTPTETHLAYKAWMVETFGETHVWDVYDYFTAIGKTRADYMVDSLHYNAEGYALIAKGIYAKLRANGWVEPKIDVTGITLSETSGNLYTGGTVTLKATVTPNNATNKKVTWSTSDDTIATVSDGVVTAVAAGNATITATTNDGGYTATYDLTVAEKKATIYSVDYEDYAKKNVVVYSDGGETELYNKSNTGVIVSTNVFSEDTEVSLSFTPTKQVYIQFFLGSTDDDGLTTKYGKYGFGCDSSATFKTFNANKTVTDTATVKAGYSLVIILGMAPYDGIETDITATYKVME